MSDEAHYLTFEGRIDAVPWGKSVYTVLILPDEIAAELSSQGAKRVEGEINDHPINLGISKADAIPGTFLWTGKSLLTAAGLTPGEILDVRLRKADETVVDLPDDVEDALLQADLRATWDALTPGKQRGFLHQIDTAKKAETRMRRIKQLTDSLT